MQPKVIQFRTGKKSVGRVDRNGGDKRAGLIRDAAVVSIGEAIGHGQWVDATTLSQVHQAINATADGVKSRYTHPSIVADGLGTLLGRVKRAMNRPGNVRADLHFSPTAHDTPDGNLADYVMRLAEDDPNSFGLSVAFLPDFLAEQEFIDQHSAGGRFRSPDQGNVKNLPHVRLSKLLAVDVVDDPAANPDGLFQQQGVTAFSRPAREESFSDPESRMVSSMTPSQANRYREVRKHHSRSVAMLTAFINVPGRR